MHIAGEKTKESELCVQFRTKISLGSQRSGGMAHMTQVLRWIDVGPLGSTGQVSLTPYLRVLPFI